MLYHPRWWNHFTKKFSNVFGNSVAELVKDLSHPVTKVNNKDDAPYCHNWDHPYYVASMADVLVPMK